MTTKNYLIKDKATGRIGFVKASTRKTIEAARTDFGFERPEIPKGCLCGPFGRFDACPVHKEARK